MADRPSRKGVLFLLASTLLLFVGAPAANEDLGLVEAAKNQDTQQLRALLTRHADVNARSEDGSTALLWVAHWNDLETAELLVRAGADANAANDFRMTPLVIGETAMGNFVSTGMVSWGVGCIIAAAVVLVLGARLGGRLARLAPSVRTNPAVAALAALMLAQIDLVEGAFDRAEAILDATFGAAWPPAAAQERSSWLLRAELALARGKPAEALGIADHLIASAANRTTTTVIPALWLVRGGALAALGRSAEAEEALLRYPGWEAEYRLKVLSELDERPSVLLFTTAPAHKGLGDPGSEVVAELIKTYSPRVAVVGGREPKQEQLGRSLLVCPGRLAEGEYSLVELQTATVERRHLSAPTAVET